MPKSLVRSAAFLMFVFFLTNFGAWGYSGARLAHELDHVGKIEIGATLHDHGHGYHAGDVNDDDDTTSAAEHQILHAVDHLQFFADTGLKSAVAVATGGVVTSYFAEQSPPLPTSDLPFRPPRRGNLPA